MLFEQKLSRLLDILNIPIREKWVDTYGTGTYSIYTYWRNLGLIPDAELEQINQSRQMLNWNLSIERYFKVIDQYWSPSLYVNGLVADVGSGFGYLTYWLLLSGARQVLTIGDPNRIDFIERLYQAAVKEGLLLDDQLIVKPSFVKCGDRTLSDQIEDNSLSLVFLNDTLEHITPRILPSLLDASYNNLRPGGKLISRQHNSDNPKQFNEMKEHWDEIEASSFVPTRKRLVQELLPEAKAADLDQLAISTRGLDRLGFEQAVTDFQERGVFPTAYQTLPAIDITCDIPSEGDTSKARILEAMKTAKFSSANVYPALLERRVSQWLWPVAKLVPSVFFSFNLFDLRMVFVATK